MSYLNELDKIRVLRPAMGIFEENEFHIPVIKRTPVAAVNWEEIDAISFKNVSSHTEISRKIIMMYSFDKDLLRLWNNPLKVIPKYQTVAFVCTPDFSVYPDMNPNEIQHNVFMNRWLGRTWQNYGCRIIPTVQWGTPETFDICLGAIEEHSAVTISTIGCQNNREAFFTRV